ncbi:MAG: hypothetical protein JNJ45_10090 [Chthonomonas sp.]|nr:hypothetical protein [Chthonomonas sp.]
MGSGKSRQRKLKQFLYLEWNEESRSYVREELQKLEILPKWNGMYALGIRKGHSLKNASLDEIMASLDDYAMAGLAAAAEIVADPRNGGLFNGVAIGGNSDGETLAIQAKIRYTVKYWENDSDYYGEFLLCVGKVSPETYGLHCEARSYQEVRDWSRKPLFSQKVVKRLRAELGIDDSNRPRQP